ncbi:hypothetical protein [Mycobacteroides abscessus]|uniref:hypothetical protein n=1 Tax=Mycobacteroides abscessus TaxID=36809 RepID=UPI0012FFF907|nr:hypothetical protein [Mycobacteroides abscessus]
MNTSIHCDKGEHSTCGGTAVIFETEDRPNRYACESYCHNSESNKRPCCTCPPGTGHVHDVRTRGLSTTLPGPLSSRP